MVKVFNKKSFWIFFIAVTLAPLSFMSFPAYADPTTDDDTEKQQDADSSLRSAYNGRTGGIFNRLSEDGCTRASGTGPVSTEKANCVVTSCYKMSNFAYFDACIKYGLGIHSCDMTSATPTYIDCVAGITRKCNFVPQVNLKGSNARDFCLNSAAYYISGAWNNADHEDYGKHGVAHFTFGQLVRGQLDLGEAVTMIDNIKNGLPPAGEPTDPGGEDTDGDGTPDAEDPDPTNSGCKNDQGEQVACSTIEKSLDCTVPAGQPNEGEPGIKVSIKINGTDCIAKGNGNINQNPIFTIMQLVLQVVSAGVGLVVAIMIIVAGIQYSSAQGNPQLIQAAKQRLMNAIIGLVMYIFAFALLNYLVPGGLIG